MNADVYFKLTKEQQKMMYSLDLKAQKLNEPGKIYMILGQAVKNEVGFGLIEHDKSCKIMEILDPEKYQDLISRGLIVPQVNETKNELNTPETPNDKNSDQ